MKTIFTSKTHRFIALTFVFAYLSLNLNAQTTHNVSVTNYAFTQAQLTITAGDKVIWTNNSGMGHNVNGTKATFPNNPVSFGNNVSANWVYEFVFTTAGVYDYHCDPHSTVMMGKITVTPNNTTSAINLDNKVDNIRLYPNPASSYIELKLPAGYEKISSLRVYSIAGTLMDEKSVAGNAGTLKYNISKYKSGVYFMEINAGNRKDVLKFLKN